MSTPEPAPEHGQWQPAPGGADPEPSGATSAAAVVQRRPPRLAWVPLEVVLAVLLVAAAFTAWGRAFVTIELPVQISATVTRLMGNWIALAIAAVTVAGLFALDALRRVVVRWHIRRGTAQPSSQAPAHGEA